jgi:hypothetical protein
MAASSFSQYLEPEGFTFRESVRRQKALNLHAFFVHHWRADRLKAGRWYVVHSDKLGTQHSLCHAIMSPLAALCNYWEGMVRALRTLHPDEHFTTRPYTVGGRRTYNNMRKCTWVWFSMAFFLLAVASACPPLLTTRSVASSNQRATRSSLGGASLAVHGPGNSSPYDVLKGIDEGTIIITDFHGTGRPMDKRGAHVAGQGRGPPNHPSRTRLKHSPLCIWTPAPCAPLALAARCWRVQRSARM